MHRLFSQNTAKKTGCETENLSCVETSKTNESNDFYKITAFDVVLVALILLFSIGVIFHTRLGLNGQSSKVAEASVYHEGNLLKNVKLEKDQEFSLLDGKMLIEIKEGRIRVRESDCPRQICVNTGWIQYPGESVVCVPYKVLIEVKSAGTPVVDAVVY
jgi:hypothetical protein